MKKLFLTLGCLVILLSISRLSLAQRGGFGAGKGIFFSAPPRLMSPVTDNIDLSGKKTLEFRWICEMINTDGFDFRLYKGYNPIASTLIRKEKISKDNTAFNLDAGIFETGQSYTWSLQRTVLSGEKSDRVYASFKVINK